MRPAGRRLCGCAAVRSMARGEEVVCDASHTGKLMLYLGLQYKVFLGLTRA
jgi:hypothetical protein